jgi:hypothetical protein
MSEHIERMAEACDDGARLWNIYRTYEYAGAEKTQEGMSSAARLLRALAAAPPGMSVQAFREMHGRG